MRLLKRERSGVSFTKDLNEAELANHPYAILSHTWGVPEDEVTFDDIADGTAVFKSGLGSEKLRFCMRQTRQDEIEYFWIDTCCIDKKNNTELSEALNSMFRWYAGAQRCYVYMSDVDVRKGEAANKSIWEPDFRSSRWFKRAWTLQELIAPTNVDFYASTGERLGNRTTLEQEINEVTRIPHKVLKGVPISEYSIAERKQWQEGRKASKPEDMVYAMLGLLEISLPAIYGIGEAEARRKMDNEVTTKHKGSQHEDYTVTFSLPVLETHNFVARRQELEEMRSALRSDGSRRYAIIHALGGMGKTQLAIAYAVRHRDDYSAVFWIDASDADSAKSSIVRIARQILRKHANATGLAGLDFIKDADELVRGTMAWLSAENNTRWLLICDNYDNPKVPGNTDPAAIEIRDYLPDAYQGSVIITTRSSEVKLGYRMRLKKLDSLEDGLLILQHASGRTDLSRDEAAIKLAKKLDGLPLALATAGAYLSQNNLGFEEYLEFFDSSWGKLQRLSPALMTYENRALFSTWQVSFTQIMRRNEASANLLRLWAYLDNQDVWFELLCHRSGANVPWLAELTKDKLDFQACMQVLCDHGLVDANNRGEHTSESTGYSVHACVHSWMQSVLNERDDPALMSTAMYCVAAHIPDRQTANWALNARRLLNHVNRCIEYIDKVQEDINYAWAAQSFGDLYRHFAKMNEAEQMYLKALKMNEMNHGTESHYALNTINSLGLCYWKQGRLNEAEERYRQLLAVRERVLEPDDVSLFMTINNLGLVLWNKGNLTEADQLYTRALNGYERVLGPDASLSLSTLNNLALVRWNLGKLEEAEEMYKRALKGNEAILGPDHTAVYENCNNLALVYADMGRLDEAEALYKRALEGNERAFGEAHTLCAENWNNLALVYVSQNRLEEAERAYKHSLKIKTLVQGAQHQLTLDTLNNLGLLHVRQGRLAEAEECYRRSKQGYDNMSPMLQSHVRKLERALNNAREREEQHTEPPPTTSPPPPQATAGATRRGIFRRKD